MIQANRKARWWPALALAVAQTWVATSAQALQLIDAADGMTVDAVMAAREPTRIRIDGAPITDVVGNLYAARGCEGAPGSSAGGGVAGGVAGLATPATPAVNPHGEIALECNRDKGEIFIRPVGSGTRPVNLFVSSARATYTLLLRRSDTPADTIVIRDRTRLRLAPVARAELPLGPMPSHLRALKALLVVMVTERVPSDIHVEEVGRPIRLWREVKFELLRTFEGRGLIGERYHLTNVSASTLVLADQEFDREEGQVLAIAIENHNLRPGASTAIYVLRQGETR